MMKKFALLVLAIIIVVGVVVWRRDHSVTPPSQTQQTSHHATTTQHTASFNKHQYSLADPTSIWVIVNKQHPLQPKDYIPPDLVVPKVPLRVPGNESMQLRKVTATAMQTMFAAAQQQGIDLMLASGYRSYTYQVGLYNGYVKTEGRAAADTQSARPGYSEHQTGLAADIEGTDRTCELEQCFGTTPEGKWLAANAYKYGFIIRYTKADENTTGYEYEPWHVRFVGTALSEEMHRAGIATLEQFFGVSGGTKY